MPHPFIDVSDAYLGISFERPDLQKKSVEQRMKEYKNVPENVPENRSDFIVVLIKNNGKITILEIAKKVNVNEKTIKRDIAKLKEKGLLKRIGPDKGGHWAAI